MSLLGRNLNGKIWRILLQERYQPKIAPSSSFRSSSRSSSSSSDDIEAARIKKLRALFGAPVMAKPQGKPVEPSSTEIEENGESYKSSAAGYDDEHVSAEDIWMDSGYIEYMENQRKEGWKT